MISDGRVFSDLPGLFLRNCIKVAILAVCISLPWATPSSAQSNTAGGAAAKPASRASERCTYGEACRLIVGKNVSWSVTTFCHDSLGNPIDDTVTLTASGYPTADASLSITPNPMHTFTNAVILLQTTADTVPNNYNIAVSGEGTICGHYPFNPPSTPLELVKPAVVNFQQVGPGVEQPDAVLHFDYIWDSSTGNLADLADCQVGEKVGYPGSGNPYIWASPPYSGSSPDPTILWVPGTDGAAQDNHSHVNFITPYTANRFVAKQDYRYKCRFGNKIEYTDVPGFTDISILRTVKDSTGQGCFKYRITKSGSEASERLPGVTALECTKSPATIMRLASNSNVDTTKVDLSVSVSEASIGVNEPVFAELTVLNRQSQNTEIDLGLNRNSNLELTIRPPQGAVENRRLDAAGFGRSGKVSLTPGGIFKERLLLNEWYRFTQAGTYGVTVTLLGGSSAVGHPPSQEFAVHIHSRDPAHVRRAAGALADTAIMGVTLEDRIEAAKALSYMVDPLAVPSLRRVLEQGSLVQHFAVEGLGRIANHEAIAALKSAQYHHPDEDVRAAARSMLTQVQGAPRPVPQPTD